MRTTSSLTSYPVFPNWVFEGTLPVTEQIMLEIKQDLDKLAVNKTEYGFVTEPNKLNQATFNFNRVVGSLFYDTALAHFQLTPEFQNIESVDSQFHVIRPCGHRSVVVNRHRWYAGAVFLECDQNSSSVYLDMLDNKLIATPPTVQPYQHHITSKKLKVAFWPAHIPWGFSVNNRKTNDILFTTTFIIKRG